jgi:hypothetical protein
MFLIANNEKHITKRDLILWPSVHEPITLTHELHSVSLLDYKVRHLNITLKTRGLCVQ